MPAAGGFRDCFPLSAPLSGGPEKHRGPCRGSGSCGRLPSRDSILLGTPQRPARGRDGIPKGTPLGAGPGRRESRFWEACRPQGPAVRGRRAGIR